MTLLHPHFKINSIFTNRPRDIHFAAGGGTAGEREIFDIGGKPRQRHRRDRLAERGILVAPVGPHHGTQTLVRVTRTDSGFERKELVDVRFVPALPGIAREL